MSFSVGRYLPRVTLHHPLLESTSSPPHALIRSIHRLLQRRQIIHPIPPHPHQNISHIPTPNLLPPPHLPLHPRLHLPHLCNFPFFLRVRPAGRPARASDVEVFGHGVRGRPGGRAEEDLQAGFVDDGLDCCGPEGAEEGGVV